MGLPVRRDFVSIFVLRQTEDEGCQLLLVRRVQPPCRGLWFQITGRIEEGEAAVEAARREVVEETSMQPSSLYAGNHVSSFYETAFEAVVLMPHFVAFVERDSEVVLNGENSCHDWVDADEVDACLSLPVQREAWRIVKENFVDRSPCEYLKVS